MGWKFWDRVFGSKESAAQSEAVPVSPEQVRVSLPFPMFPSSNREVVALQRLVGNQVVLKMLARPSVKLELSALRDEQGTARRKGFSGWFRRDAKREEQN